MAPPLRIRSAAVLGAGTMGAQIAAHLANAGYPVQLLDVTAAAAKAGLERARALKPDPFFTRQAADLIQVGGFDSHLERIATADWIVEAIIEQPDAKRTLLERVDAVRSPGRSSARTHRACRLPDSPRDAATISARHWLGTHFFNPPRYLPLLELIPTTETDAAAIDAMREFADRRLGKNVVLAKDTPGFIANHVAMFGLLRIFEALARGRIRSKRSTRSRAPQSAARRAPRSAR